MSIEPPKTELIDKLLHLGYTTEMCCSTDQHNAKELAHTLLDEYLQAINYTHCCKSDSEQLHTKVFNLANELAKSGYGNEAVRMHHICNGM